MRRAETRDLYLATVLVLVRASALSPSLATKRALVSLLAATAGALPSSKNERRRRAIVRAFPHISDRQKALIERQSRRTTWTEILSWAPCPGEREDWRRARVVGAEHLEAALGRGRGVVLWESTGFGHREPVKQWLSDQGHAPVQVHGPNALGTLEVPDLPRSRFRATTLGPAFAALERRRVAEILTLNANGPSVGVLRAVARHLGQNDVVCITGDGREGRLIEVPMLGGAEPFATGIANLVRSSGSGLLPIFCWRCPDGRLQIAFDEPVDASGSDKRGAIRRAIERYAERLVAHIRESPGQYRNWHLLGATRS